MNELLAILVGINITIVVIGQVINNKRFREVEEQMDRNEQYSNNAFNNIEDNLNNHDKDIRLVLGQYAWDLKDIKDTSLENKKAIMDELNITKDEIKKKTEIETTRAILTPYRYLAK